MTFGGITPTKISALGVEVGAIEPRALVVAAATIQLWLLVSFAAQASVDELRSMEAFQRVRNRLVERIDEITRPEDEDDDVPISPEYVAAVRMTVEQLVVNPGLRRYAFRNAIEIYSPAVIAEVSFFAVLTWFFLP